METFWQDLRYSLRTLFKKPGFTFVVVATLALGIGANATIFTWIKAVLLASLSGIEQPERLVEIVSQRTRELGIHMSVGAAKGDVMKLILRQSVTLAAIGITSGLIVAIALTRLSASLLYGISPTDPATFSFIAALVFIVALLAGYFPARRATKVDPIIALRTE